MKKSPVQGCSYIKSNFPDPSVGGIVGLTINRCAYSLLLMLVQDISKKFEFEKGSRDRNKK